MTTYVVPDAPADPEAAALELIVRLPIDLLAPGENSPGESEGLRRVLQDYAGVLHAEGVFAGLAWEDAKQIAAAVALDVVVREDAPDFLRDRARNVAAGTDNVAWHDRARVARALNIAATAFEL
jgi:hypothetical protein